jgi:hypothetical protein
MSEDRNDQPNRRDVLVSLTAGVAATALPAGALARGGPPAHAGGPPAHAGGPHGGPPGLAADAELIADAITAGWNAWLAQAEYSGGSIQAQSLEGGSLTSPVDAQPIIEANLLAAGVRADAALDLSVAAAANWEDWAADWSLPASDAFPTFAAVAAPEAAETTAQPLALQPEASTSYSKITTDLEADLDAAIDKGDGPIKGTWNISALVQSVAIRVGQRVEGWSAGAMVEGIRGGGPIPTFAPPYIPVGPVVAGDNIATPGHLMNITPMPGGPPLVELDVVEGPITKF